MKHPHASLSALAMSFCIVSQNAQPCSEIFVQDAASTLVSARNFDFERGHGFVTYHPAGLTHAAQFAPPGTQPQQWTSRFASLSFDVSLPAADTGRGAVYAAGVDGINEAGLKVGTYVLRDSTYPVQLRETALDTASLMGYLLDQFDSVTAALADLEAAPYRVVPTPVTISSGQWGVALHLYLHDASGASAIVEYLDGQLRITRNPAVAVLTNSTYQQSLQALERFRTSGSVPGSPESLDRFVRGAYYSALTAAPASAREAVSSGFARIQVLAIPLTVNAVGAQGGTQWTIVTDIPARTVHFRTGRNPQIASINLKLLASMKSLRKKVRVDLMRTDLVGDISRLFFERATPQPTVTSIYDEE